MLREWCSMAGTDQMQKMYAQVIAKAWADDAFKERLIAEPHAALKEMGITVPDGYTVRAMENTSSDFHIVIPPKPDDDELSEDEMDQVAGGFQYGCCMSASGCLGCSGLTQIDPDLLEEYLENNP